MIKKISSIVILVCIILFNITPIVMAADYAELGDSSAASGSLSEETEHQIENEEDNNNMLNHFIYNDRTCTFI